MSEEDEKDLLIDRLQYALAKCADWAGVDIDELIHEGYLNEGDM